jgi:uncharacterized SAM-binding protein YcdF (DUF218 family)
MRQSSAQKKYRPQSARAIYAGIHATKRVKKGMRMILSLLSLLAIIWVIGWISFLRNVPMQSAASNTDQADAIIVLTGGSLRVEHGLEQLAKHLAPQLLISGVGGEIGLDALLKTHASTKVQQAIAQNKSSILLDHMARSTRTNALETAIFVNMHQLHSIRLITANYHMPRSLLEMRYVMPDITIIPDAVFPKGFTKKDWWSNAHTRNLLLVEFHKIWVVRLRHLLRFIDPFVT